MGLRRLSGRPRVTDTPGHRDSTSFLKLICIAYSTLDNSKFPKTKPWTLNPKTQALINIVVGLAADKMIPAKSLRILGVEG